MNTYSDIAILGGTGFIGRAIYNLLKEKYNVISISKENYDENIGKKFDVLINANGNSKKFWANENPFEDFEKSTRSVYKSLFDFKYDKYIYISTIDIYQRSPYGFNKTIAEKVIQFYAPNHIILRCALVIGENVKKGIVHDILNDTELHVSIASEYSIITNTEVANIVKHVMENENPLQAYDIGGMPSMTVEQIAKILNKECRLNNTIKSEHYKIPVNSLVNYKLKTSEEYLKEIL
jgi:dTDP-4-dehydrorhamnose reductase